MPKSLTADDVLPLIAALTTAERARLLRLITQLGSDEAIDRSLPPRPDEFGADEEPLAWEAEGWEEVA
jgi:hypothetical protein